MDGAPSSLGVRDADVGIESFLTSTPGIGGRLKVRVDDFRVDEVAPRPEPDPQGAFVAARVRLTNWDTYAFVREASERLGISRKKVRFSGTKDKRGITERWFTMEAPPQQVGPALAALGGVEVLETVRTATELTLGAHEGNRFRLVVRAIELPAPHVEQHLRATAQQTEAAGGFPNFFGPQRFGARRAITHKVGRSLVRGRFDEAVQIYLTEPGPTEEPERVAARQELARTHDWKRGLTTLGHEPSERALLHHLAERPEDPIRALLALPDTLQRLFVYAYQSYLFNQILSRRLKAGLALGEPLVGDLVAPLEGGRLQEEWVPVRTTNRARVATEIQRGRAVLTGLLPGTEAPQAEGEMGRIERAVLEAEGLSPRDFLIPEHLEWSSKGTRRALGVRPHALRWTTAPDALHPGRTEATLEFELPPGAYATSVMREFLKSSQLADYG